MLEPEAEKPEPWALWLTEQRRLRKGNGWVLLQRRFWIKCKKVCRKICKKVQEWHTEKAWFMRVFSGCKKV